IDTIKQMQINIQTLACDTTLRPKPQCFQNPTLFSVEYLNNLTEMVRFVQNTYFKEGNQEIIKTIWPEMYDSLQSGNS
ncbi:hypothetical protein ACE4Z6_28090, partial [Salmonella enterica]|uniref:hypothetical protein n=1 Tax=Salmonella enterica TaxID=28901 RepID=UPI003D2C610D